MMNEFVCYIKSLILPSTAAETEAMTAGALSGCLVSLLLGGLDKAIYALTALAIIDYLTGVAASMKECRLSSAAGFKGVIKKVIMFAVVALANLIDTGMQVNILRDVVVAAYAANEGLSILENLDRCGWGQYVPVFLQGKIEEIKLKKTGGGV